MTIEAEALEYVRSYDGTNRFIRSLKGRKTLTPKQAVVVLQIRGEAVADRLPRAGKSAWSNKRRVRIVRGRGR